MKKSVLFICLCGMLFFNGMAVAEETVEEEVITGRIQELAKDKSEFQMRDIYLFKVGDVYLDDGTGEIVQVGKSRLEEKVLVKVYVGDKQDTPWEAKKIVILEGEAEAAYYAELED